MFSRLVYSSCCLFVCFVLYVCCCFFRNDIVSACENAFHSNQRKGIEGIVYLPVCLV